MTSEAGATILLTAPVVRRLGVLRSRGKRGNFGEKRGWGRYRRRQTWPIRRGANLKLLRSCPK